MLVTKSKFEKTVRDYEDTIRLYNSKIRELNSSLEEMELIMEQNENLASLVNSLKKKVDGGLEEENMVLSLEIDMLNEIVDQLEKEQITAMERPVQQEGFVNY